MTSGHPSPRPLCLLGPRGHEAYVKHITKRWPTVLSLMIMVKWTRCLSSQNVRIPYPPVTLAVNGNSISPGSSLHMRLKNFCSSPCDFTSQSDSRRFPLLLHPSWRLRRMILPLRAQCFLKKWSGWEVSTGSHGWAIEKCVVLDFTKKRREKMLNRVLSDFCIVALKASLNLCWFTPINAEIFAHFMHEYNERGMAIACKVHCNDGGPITMTLKRRVTSKHNFTDRNNDISGWFNEKSLSSEESNHLSRT